MLRCLPPVIRLALPWLLLPALLPAQTTPLPSTPQPQQAQPQQPLQLHASADLAPALQELARNHLAEAEMLVRREIALHPEDASAHFLLGDLLFRQHRAADSLAAYTAGARFQTPAAADLTVVALDYILLKDLPDAEKWFRFALQSTPDDAHLWYLLGRAQYGQDHNADAAASFERTLKLSPRDLRAQYNLGLAYEKLGRPEDAIAAYRTAISWQAGQPQQDPQPFLDLGTLLLHQGHPTDALPPLREATRFGPNNPMTFQELGLALEAAGQLEEAVPSFQRAASLAPDSEQPHFFLGRVLRRLGRAAEADAEYREVARILGTRSSTPTPNVDQDSPSVPPANVKPH